MGFLKNFARNFVLRSDMFAAAPTMRYNGQASYQSLCGGTLSILLVLGFIGIFFTSFIDVLTKINITFSSQVQDNAYDTNQISGIMMAVGIEGIDYNASQSYFSLFLDKISRNGRTVTTTAIALQPCNIDNWKNLGTNFQLLYKIYQMEKMLCPTSNADLTVSGFEGAETQQFLLFRVEQCLNLTGWNCHTTADINAYRTNHFLTNDYFKIQLLMIDTLLTPNEDVYINKAIENEIFLTFGQSSGSKGIIKLGHYNVTTDNSIWPAANYTSETGHFIDDFSTHSIQLHSTHYCQVMIEKSRKVTSISRLHEKIDTMLSYVGGLFALLFGWIFFFISSYNEYNYELAVAENSFAMDQTGRKVKTSQFGFITYLQYAIFDWLKAFNIHCKWQKMQEFDKVRGEAVEQMDTKLIIKRIQRYEIMLQFLLHEHNLVCANLSRPPSLQKIKQLRLITQYYDKVVKSEMEQNILNDLLKNSIEKDVESQSEFQEDDSDFDSDDEEVEKKIIEQYEKASKLDCQLTKKIVKNIPHHMKRRLAARKVQSSKRKLQIQQVEQIENDTTYDFKRRETPNSSNLMVLNVRPTH